MQPHNPDTPENDAPAPEAQSPELNADPAAQIALLEQQIAALKEQGLRYLAEAENTRRRAVKEREEAGKYAVAGFARELLAVADNFERAMAAAPEAEAMPGAVKNLLDGIAATGRQLAAAFERAGIKKIEALGQTFDPNLHRVMMEVEDDSSPPGTVTQVLQTGYVIHDRLLREALVAVSKGGAAAARIDATA